MGSKKVYDLLFRLKGDKTNLEANVMVRERGSGMNGEMFELIRDLEDQQTALSKAIVELRELVLG